jgi:hypothetical protein
MIGCLSAILFYFNSYFCLKLHISYKKLLVKLKTDEIKIYVPDVSVIRSTY